MYSRCGDLRHAFILFQQIEENSLSSWNSIISGYAYNERSEETCFLLKEMLLAGFHPNHVTLASILPLCARMANLQHGKEFHCYVLRRESFKDCLTLWNSLVDMYAKSGNIIAAKQVYDSMSKRNKVTYTSLIDGYGMVGEGEVALAWFDDMIRSGIKPDHVTMVAVLSACSHSSLVREGEIQFRKMWYVFDILPRLEHYSCMVDLYCRAGRLAADLLREMEPVNLRHCLLIVDMYRVTGSWSKLEEVKTLMSVMDPILKEERREMKRMKHHSDMLGYMAKLLYV